MEKQSLKQLIESTAIGETFTTSQTRAGISQAAKRAGVTVKTSGEKGNYQVTILTQVKHKRSVFDIVHSLSIADRLALFEHFELCCGMDRGQCICPEEIIERPQVVVKQDDALAAFIAKAQAAKGITQTIDVPIETIDEWAGWSEPRQARDDEASEIIHYREHIKTGKRSILSRETAW
jgi:hypothetical protein